MTIELLVCHTFTLAMAYSENINLDWIPVMHDTQKQRDNEHFILNGSRTEGQTFRFGVADLVGKNQPGYTCKHAKK